MVLGFIYVNHNWGIGKALHINIIEGISEYKTEKNSSGERNGKCLLIKELYLFKPSTILWIENNVKPKFPWWIELLLHLSQTIVLFFFFFILSLFLFSGMSQNECAFQKFKASSFHFLMEIKTNVWGCVWFLKKKKKSAFPKE